MEDKVQQQQHDPNSPKHSTEKSDQPVRSRWTPKPEQILILESIFNSGMVNPPKDETIRIRKLLEKFGAVGDANVFYWFQNRRSRSRRRQRQLQQASLEQRNQMMVQVQQQQQPQQQVNNVVAGAIPFDHHQQQLQINPTMGFVGSSSSSPSFTDSSGSSSSSCGGGGGGGGGVLGCQQSMDGFFSVSSQMGFPGIDQTFAASSLFCPTNLNYQSGAYTGASVAGFITVFINGIATEVQAGPIDMKTVFGDDVMLVHSSGVPVPTNEYGFLMQSLEHGESYFLVGIKVNTSMNGSACGALEAFFNCFSIAASLLVFDFYQFLSFMWLK